MDALETKAVDDLVALCRLFPVLEREWVCCGQVTPAQCAVLQDLLGGPQDVSSLATTARLTKSGMTRLLDGLVKLGFVDRGRDDTDRRRVMVALTTAGRAEAQRLRGCTQDLVGRVLAVLNPDAQPGAAHALSQIRHAVEGLLDLQAPPPKDPGG